jgi:hypothetical protein
MKIDTGENLSTKEAISYKEHFLTNVQSPVWEGTAAFHLPVP